MDVLFFMSIFRLYPGLKKSLEHNSVRKNLFLSACFCWDSRFSLREVDQQFQFGRTIGSGNSYFEFFFRHFKVFRLHAILNDAVGAVPAESGEGPGYCYMIGRGLNSCLLGYLTGLLFCLYVKLFLPSIFNSVDFWSSMSCIVPDIVLADENVFKELGVFIDGKGQGYSFYPPKLYKPRKQAFWWTRNLHCNVWNSGCLDHSELANILSRAVKGKHFAKRTEKCRIRGNLLEKEMDNLKDHGCPKIQGLRDGEIYICSTYPFRHKTTIHCAERKAKLFGNWIMQPLMF